MSEQERSILKWIAGWTAVYLANLPLLVWLGIHATSHHERIGMWAGVWLMWAIGAMICSRPSRFRQALVLGSLWFMWVQCIPIPHLIAGLIAVITWEQLGEAIPNGIKPLLEGFMITVMTGQLLLIPAVLIGYMASAIFGGESPPQRYLPPTLGAFPPADAVGNDDTSPAGR